MLFLTQPLLAQNYPEAPANCELMLRVGSMDSTSAYPDRQTLAAHPIMRLIKVSSLKYLGMDLMADLGDAFEGTIVAGIVNPSGESSLVEFFSDLSLREDRSRIVSEMEYFVEGLEEYHSEEESYPADLDAFKEKKPYHDFPVSSEATFLYKVSDGGQNYRLSCQFDSSSKLSRLGPAPEFTKGDGAYLVPEAAPVPLNFVIAAKVDNPSTLKQLMKKMVGEPQKGFWTERGGLTPVMATVRGEWLLVSDQMSNMGPFLKAVQGKAPGVSTRPSYKMISRNINTDSPILFYADAGSLLKNIPELRTSVEAKILDLAGPVGYAVLPYERSQLKFEMFLGVNAPKNSALKAYLEATRGTSPESVLETSNVPWDVSNLVALDFAATKELVEAALDLYPANREAFQNYQDVFAGMLGIDAEKGFGQLLDGPLLVSFEQIDFFTSGFDQFMRVMDADGQGDDKRVPAIPVTFAMQIPDPVNRSALKKRLLPFLGSKTLIDNVVGVEITRRQDGDLALAEDGAWLYASGANTDRLMRAMLKAAKGRKKTLSTLDSWARFRLAGRGRMIAFGHQKVDHFYSIVKGFLLYLGADFRPLAEELGGLRDSHSVMTAVPDGFLFVGGIVQGESR